MSERRLVWSTLANLLTRLERDVEVRLGAQDEAPAGLDVLEKEVRRLAKTQFQANALAKEQADKWEKALTEVSAAYAQQEKTVETLVAEQVARAQQAWIESLLPVLDGLDKAIASGQQYLHDRKHAVVSEDTPSNGGAQPRLASDVSSDVAQGVIGQVALAGSADRAKLASWLDGLRMVRARLLALLEAHNVSPIPTVGHMFDPYQHVVVATSPEGAERPGMIVAEEQRGYRSKTGVLRYADVVVYRPQ